MPEVREEARKDSLLDFSEGVRLASRTVRESVPVALTHLVCGTWLRQPLSFVKETNVPGREFVFYSGCRRAFWSFQSAGV